MAGNGTNGTGVWARWIIGLLIFVLLAVFGCLATGVLVNARGVSENRASLQAIGPRLHRIEMKQDKTLDYLIPSRKGQNE